MYEGERLPLVLQFLFVGKHLGYLMEQRLARRGLNRTQTLVLIALRRHPGLKVLDLCGPARVEPASVTRTLQSLERLDLLERRPHPTDGRASLFYLTDAGQSLAGDLSREVESLSTELLREMDPGDLAHLESVLGALWRAVSGRLAAAGPQPPAVGFQPGACGERLPEEEPEDQAAGAETERHGTKLAEDALRADS